MGNDKVIDKLAEAVRKAAEYNSASQVAPSCILWPDAERQFESVKDMLLAALPEMLVLGDYDPAGRTGPAIWIRCALAGKVDGFDPNAATPVIYLPGIARSDFRIVETLPDNLRPLAYYAFRGTVFQQKNGKDWTCLAFLVSNDAGGLGLEVSGDMETKASLQSALPQILTIKVSELSSGRLDAGDFDETITGSDTDKLMLQWLSGGDKWRKEQDAAKWKAFASICKSKYALNPETDGTTGGLRRLAMRQGAWKAVFERYEESYTAYPQILSSLLTLPPPQFNLFDGEAECGGWPQWNDGEEHLLKDNIAAAAKKPPADALKILKDAEQRHGVRRRTVWAKLGLCPFASALAPLLELGKRTTASLPTFASIKELSDWFDSEGWLVDMYALRAAERISRASPALPVLGTIRNFYHSWLSQINVAFQEFVKQSGYPESVQSPAAEGGTWCIFVDGLRLDLARELANLVETKGYAVAEGLRWAPVPTITPCGKARAVPGGALSPGAPDETYDPVKASGTTFAKYLAANGFAEGVPGGAAKSWSAFGDIDTGGHEFGESMASFAYEALKQVALRIDEAFAAGAKSVRIVTDHGWLWMPGALPKYELPKGLVMSKSKRFAALKPGVSTDEVELGWTWNQEAKIAFSPGICSHVNGTVYAHGGLSLQECRIADLTITKAGMKSGAVGVKEISWRGVRFLCKLNGDFSGVSVDFRSVPHDGRSLISGGKKSVSPEGEVKGLIEEEDLTGKGAYLVILDADGDILAQNKVAIGGFET